MDKKLIIFSHNSPAASFAEVGEGETTSGFITEEQAAAKVVEKPIVNKKPIASMIIFGALSLSGYIALMTHQGWVCETFTRGGWHAAYPVVTALAFSFVHGAFASNLLSVLGIEAKK